MKFVLPFVVLLTACSTFAAQKGLGPEAGDNGLSGEAFFQTLLKNVHHRLKDESRCPPPANAVDQNAYTLGDQLSVLLAIGHESRNNVTLESGCRSTKAEQQSGETVDVWDCQVKVIEINADGEFVASSTVVAAISRPERQLVAGSLRCL